MSISLLPATYAAVLFGPLAGMVVFGASVIGLSMPLPGRMAYFGNRTLTGAAAAGSAAAVVTVMPSAGIGQVVAASAAAALVAEVLDAALASVVFSAAGQGDFPSGLLRTHPGDRRFGSDLQPRRGCSCSCLPRSLAVDAALVLYPCAWPPRDGSCCIRSSGGLRQTSAA